MDPVQQITSFSLGSSGLISVLTDESAQQSPIARLQRYLYVRSKLDTALLPAIRRGDYDLVVISGNAGDGKSAFLLQLGDDEIAADGRQIRVNRDATHSDSPDETQAERILRDLAPFSDNRVNQQPSTIQVIAMNTGMLVSFFDEIRDESKFPEQPSLSMIETMLKKQLGILTASQDIPEGAWRVLLVDLNYRSVVDCEHLLDEDQGSFEGSLFSRLVGRLVDEDSPMWHRCRSSCPTNPEDCYVFQNVLALRNPVVQQRLHLLLGLIHLRGDQHLSVRTLLNLLSYLIAGHFRYYQGYDDFCQRIADWIEEDATGELLGRMYYNAVFSDSPLFDDTLVSQDEELTQERYGEGGQLVEALNRLDFVAQSGEAVDEQSLRFFYDQEGLLSEGKKGLESYVFDRLSQILKGWNGAIEEAAAKSRTRRERALRQHMRELRLAIYKLLKRRSYFTDKYEPVDLVMSYPHLGEFLVLLQQVEKLRQENLSKKDRALAKRGIDDLVALVTRGLLKSDRIKQASDSVQEGEAVQLRLDDELAQMDFNVLVTQQVSGSASLSDAPPIQATPFLEYAASTVSVTLKRTDGSELGQLDVDLKLYEFLHRVDQGYLPSTSDLGHFVHLQTFKNQLRRQLGDEIESLLLVDPQGTEVVRVSRSVLGGTPYYKLDAVESL